MNWGWQVQPPGASAWQPVCGDATGNCNGTCSGASCTYTFTLPTLLSAQYTLQLRAVLTGANGDPTPVSWSFLRCASTEFAVINDTDGAVECSPCTSDDSQSCAVVLL